jgi:3-oxoacyl-(acyl-carrier-protein) synthase
MELKRVVVTGLGAITPIGNNVQEYWKGLREGVSGAADITRFDSTNFKTHFACEVKGYDPQNYFDKKDVRKYDLFAQFALISADEAIAHSGITTENTDFDEVGVMWASGIGGVSNFFDEVSGFIEGGGTPRFNPFFITKMIPDMPAGLISIKNGFRGPNFATVSACASSANAIIEGFNYIRYGKSPVMIVGGAEAGIGEPGIGGFNSMHALSTRNDEPQTASRPFDAGRDGFVIGEGGGGLVLEELDHALRRGATIFAEIIGGGASADAYHITSPHP